MSGGGRKLAKNHEEKHLGKNLKSCSSFLKMVNMALITKEKKHGCC